MTFRVFSHGNLLGESELDYHDIGMNVRCGAFVPGPGYTKVQHVFRLFAEARTEDELQRYYTERSKLGLTVLDAEGRLLDAGAIHIVDFSVEAGADAYELEIYPPTI